MGRPTIGRVVYFYTAAPNHPATTADEPHPAIITKVHSDTCINLTVLPDASGPFAVTSVTQVDASEGDLAEILAGATFGWDWMPYQKQVQAGEIAPVLHAADAPDLAAQVKALADQLAALQNAPPRLLDRVEALEAKVGFEVDDGTLRQAAPSTVTTPGSTSTGPVLDTPPVVSGTIEGDPNAQPTATAEGQPAETATEPGGETAPAEAPVQEPAEA